MTRKYLAIYEMLTSVAGKAIRTMSVDELRLYAQSNESAVKPKRAGLTYQYSDEDKASFDRTVQSLRIDFSSPAAVETLKSRGIAHFTLISVTRATYQKMKEVLCKP